MLERDMQAEGKGGGAGLEDLGKWERGERLQQLS